MHRHIVLANKVRHWRRSVQALLPAISGVMRHAALYGAVVVLLIILAVLQSWHVWRTYHDSLKRYPAAAMGKTDSAKTEVEKVLDESPVAQRSPSSESEELMRQAADRGQSVQNDKESKSQSLQRERMAKPLEGKILTAYGWQEDPVHKDWRFFPGVVIQGEKDSRVYAAKSGVVKDMSENARGLHLYIAHADGMVTIYRHISDCSLHVGEHVKQGQVVGYLSKVGELALQFEIWQDNCSINPDLAWGEQ